MAIKLTSKTNTVPSGGDYEYGSLKNTAGATPGTPVNVQVYGDFHQFFERMMDVAGIAHNDLPDNTTNGYQLFQALEKLAGSGAWIEGPAPTLTPNIGTASIFSTLYNKYKIAGKTFTWEFNGSIGTTGTPSSIKIAYPSAITIPGTSSGLPKTRFGLYLSEIMTLEIRDDGIIMRRLGGGNFAAGPYHFNFEVSFEIA